MTNCGVHLGAWAWAVHSGSHVPLSDWGKVDILRSAGITSAKYLLYEGSPDTQFEDLRRLRQERGLSEVVLRLMHGRALPTPLDHLNRYTARIDYARALGFTVVVQTANEPNLELDAMSPSEFGTWHATCAREARARWPGIEVVSPPIAPYATNTWAWWDHMREAVTASDTVGVHVYANTVEQLSGGYSLPWWLGQAPDKQLRVLETGCQTGTPADVRAAMLPRIYGQLASESRVLGWYPFIMSSEDVAHSEHWYTDAVMTLLRQVAAGVTPTVPELPAPTPPAPVGATTFTLTDDTGKRWRLRLEVLP